MNTLNTLTSSTDKILKYGHIIYYSLHTDSVISVYKVYSQGNYKLISRGEPNYILNSAAKWVA